MKVILTAFDGLLRSAVFDLPDHVDEKLDAASAAADNIEPETLVINVAYEKDVWDASNIENAVKNESKSREVREVHFHPTQTYRLWSDGYVREYELSCAVVTNDP